MAKITGQHWVIAGTVLAVYDGPECPICGQVDSIKVLAEYQQASMLPEVAVRHWDICTCERCNKSYVSYIEFDTEVSQ